MSQVEEKESNYTVGDLIYVVYKNGSSGDRRAKGNFLKEDDLSITIDIGGYLSRVFKNFIYKIEQPKRGGSSFDY